jgi:phosphate transport system substrate-binding protein
LTRRTLAVLAAIGAALVVTMGAGANASAASLTGAGSSFVAPLVSAWIPKVDAAFGVKVTYGPIGSGGGINAITNRTVDFGRAAHPRPVRRLQGLRPDSLGSVGDIARLPRRRTT